MYCSLCLFHFLPHDALEILWRRVERGSNKKFSTNLLQYYIMVVKISGEKKIIPKPIFKPFHIGCGTGAGMRGTGGAVV